MYFEFASRAMQALQAMRALQVNVEDTEGRAYVLHGCLVHDSDDSIEIYIGDLYVLVLDDEVEAHMDDLGCFKSGDIDAHTRFQGALKWLMQTYPTLHKVSFRDIAFEKESGVYLTPKRLLLGQPGWYETHYGATPGKWTKPYIAAVRRHFIHIPEQRECMSKDAWGTVEDLTKVFPYSRTLMYNLWAISKETIETYSVQIVEDTNTEAEKEMPIGLWKTRHDAYLTHRMQCIQARYDQA